MDERLESRQYSSRRNLFGFMVIQLDFEGISKNYVRNNVINICVRTSLIIYYLLLVILPRMQIAINRVFRSFVIIPLADGIHQDPWISSWILAYNRHLWFAFGSRQFLYFSTALIAFIRDILTDGIYWDPWRSWWILSCSGILIAGCSYVRTEAKAEIFPRSLLSCLTFRLSYGRTILFAAEWIYLDSPKSR